uniref:Sentrin-specific protease 1 n=1 Tax=Cacopsylla melanoneura TaxID=428564 RepID=A0A8D8W1N8_9HEMI
MGLIDYVLSFFNFKSKVIEEPSDLLSDDHFNAPFAKRFKPNHSHSVPSLNIGNMSPKQYFASKRKVPTPRKPPPPPVEIQIPESDDDDDDCTIIATQQPSMSKHNGNPKTSPANDDEIQVLSSNENQDVNIVHEESSPCSSRSQKMNHLSSANKSQAEVYSVEENEENQASNKENHHSKENKQSEDTEEIQVIEDRPSKALVIAKKIPSNQLFPRWSNVDRSIGRSLICPRSPGSSFLFNKRTNQERSSTLQHIQKLRSREDYAKLIQAITYLNGNGSSINTSREPTPLPSSSRNSSTPSGSELDILERLSSQGVGGSNPSKSRHVSIMNSGDKTKGYIDIGKALTKRTDTTSSTRFRFLDSGPQLSSSMAFVKTPKPKEDTLDAMIRKIQSIDLHRFDSDISRRALALEKTNEKVRSLEVPTYNVLLEKTINLRKVPERLQVKKVEPELPPITEELENLIRRMKGARMDTVVSKVALEEITKDQILSLEGLTWLKDNVINCYMALIMERSKAGLESSLPKVYGFNTFFHSALAENGYNRVRRWTKKIDLFSYDLILLPIHVQKIHWCLATIDFRKKCVTYYDSMAGPDRGVLNRLLKYISDESMDKKKTPFDTSSWSMQCPKDVPQQQNSCDCGVFTSTFAEYLSRNADIFKVKQKDMPYYRKKMMVEILSKKLLS